MVKSLILMGLLIMLVFQMLYNFIVAGTAKMENDGFLLNGIFSVIAVFCVLITYNM